jgi:hypothetical protein
MNLREILAAAQSTLQDYSGRLFQLKQEGFGWPPTEEGRRERRALAAAHDVGGALSRDELRRLYEIAATLDEAAPIVELATGAGQVTCFLGQLCRGKTRKLYAIWETSAADPSHPEAERFWAWHQNVIRKYLVPHVVPVLVDRETRFTPSLPERIGLLVVGPGAAPPPDELTRRAERTLVLPRDLRP